MQSDDGSWPWQDLILSLSFCKIEYNSSLSRLNSNKRKKKKRIPYLSSLTLNSFRLHIYIPPSPLPPPTKRWRQLLVLTVTHLISYMLKFSVIYPIPQNSYFKVWDLHPQKHRFYYIFTPLANETSWCFPPLGEGDGTLSDLLSSYASTSEKTYLLSMTVTTF